MWSSTNWQKRIDNASLCCYTRFMTSTRLTRFASLTVEDLIAILTRELQIRETAAPHVTRGIPQQQNQTAINELYDDLNRLHVARLDGVTMVEDAL